jgi:Uma2 family endonuclease
MATTRQRLMTADELGRLPDDGMRRDLIDGEVIELPPTNFDHGQQSNRLAFNLTGFVLRNHLGQVVGAETGFRLGREPDTVLAPDVAFVRGDRLPPRAEWGEFLEMAPDLAVEIISPSERPPAVQRKVRKYLDAGVQVVWVVYPRQQTVTIYTPDGVERVLRATDTLDGVDVLPGFALPLAELFDD